MLLCLNCYDLTEYPTYLPTYLPTVVFFKCFFEAGHAAKVVDIYRIQNGKPAEHWDVVQLLTEREACINGIKNF